MCSLNYGWDAHSCDIYVFWIAVGKSSPSVLPYEEKDWIMNKSSRRAFDIRSFGLLVLALTVLTQPLLNVAFAVNLGDCAAGPYGIETPKECTNKTFCSNSGCEAWDGGANSCSQGFAIVTVWTNAGDRIKTGTCSTSANQACATCSGRICCSKSLTYRSANCVNSCFKTQYFWTTASDKCI